MTSLSFFLVLRVRGVVNSNDPALFEPESRRNRCSLHRRERRGLCTHRKGILQKVHDLPRLCRINVETGIAIAVPVALRVFDVVEAHILDALAVSGLHQVA